MRSYSSLSSGQNYTDIVLNVYKSQNHKVVLSSFESFNVNLRSFQQNPWMANIAGAPLWSQSGTKRLPIRHELLFDFMNVDYFSSSNYQYSLRCIGQKDHSVYQRLLSLCDSERKCTIDCIRHSSSSRWSYFAFIYQ